MNLLMCQPRFYGIEYEINPWMHVDIKSDPIKATAQWRQLYETLVQCGFKVQLIEPQPQLPDMVFTANAGFIHGQQVFLSRFKFAERQGELHHFKQWFAHKGYDLVDINEETAEANFEGEGDVLWAGKKLFVGYGIRSDKDYFRNFQALSTETIVYCELINPYFYHLDTCFCALNEKEGIWWPEAFSPESQQRMAKNLKLHAVPEEEAQHFACNAVIGNGHGVIPSGCPKTKKLLQDLGLTVHECEMSEFIKSGGACKCLTLFL